MKPSWSNNQYKDELLFWEVSSVIKTSHSPVEASDYTLILSLLGEFGSYSCVFVSICNKTHFYFATTCANN